MMSRSPGPGELAAGAGGLLLLAAMFLPWFGVDASFVLPGSDRAVTVDDRSVSAWQAFGLVDLVLAATSGLAIALPVVGARGRSRLAPAVIALAALSALLIAFRLIEPPALELPDVAGNVSLEAARRIGAFFGLVFTALIAWGANRSSGDAGPLQRARAWTKQEVDERCATAWRRYDRRLASGYTAYFDRHPELRGDGRFTARSRRAALPPGHPRLARALPARTWRRDQLSGKSSQTLTVGLLGAAAERDPSLRWLFEALELPPPEAPRMTFGYTVAPELLGEPRRPTTVDVLVDDPTAVVCLETRWREPGPPACACRGEGVGPLAERCSRAVEGRRAYWATAAERFAIPAREPGGPCPLSPVLATVRIAAAARALAGPEREPVVALVYDERNPYFAGHEDWPGWPTQLRLAAISWQDLVPRLPLDEAARAWARDKHGLG